MHKQLFMCVLAITGGSNAHVGIDIGAGATWAQEASVILPSSEVGGTFLSQSSEASSWNLMPALGALVSLHPTDFFTLSLEVEASFLTFGRTSLGIVQTPTTFGGFNLDLPASLFDQEHALTGSASIGIPLSHKITGKLHGGYVASTSTSQKYFLSHPLIFFTTAKNRGGLIGIELITTTAHDIEVAGEYTFLATTTRSTLTDNSTDESVFRIIRFFGDSFTWSFTKQIARDCRISGKLHYGNARNHGLGTSVSRENGIVQAPTQNVFLALGRAVTCFVAIEFNF